MLSVLLVLVVGASPQETLDEMREMLLGVGTWNRWLRETGELPPDFDSIPSRAVLPGPLDGGRFGGAGAVSSPGEWAGRRECIMQSLYHWILGSVPPRPDNMESEVVDERAEEGGVSRKVVLRFGREGSGVLHLELIMPNGAGPFPVFMTQTNHRGWGLIAVRRGYMACVYDGCDMADDTVSFVEAYPGYEWSRLTRRAWAAGRCVDYLEGVSEARADQIAVTGHSRNGKTSLMASAMDARMAVVISSSSGTGGAVASRYHGEHQAAEGIENITRSFPEWFHPRWRFFSGREDKLPVDLTDLVAMSAPRACLISTALNDSVESTWSIQQTLLAVRPVYELLGAGDKLKVLWRPGGHETWPTVIERYVDWCDVQFGRGDYAFPDRMIHPWDWAAWSKTDGHRLDPAEFERRDGVPGTLAEWQARRAELPEAMGRVLGSAPGGPTAPGTYGGEPAHIERMLRRDNPPSGLEKDDVVFGEYINGDVYVREGAKEGGEKLPGVLWLHPWTCPTGYVPAYRRGDAAYLSFAKAGYAVFCYDQIGFGRRVEEVEDFYWRYPDWSLLGKMVRDARAALDAMERLDYVDPARIYVVGYAFGAYVALHLAGVDERPWGYALACPPVPYRLDTEPERTGGIARWARLYMVAPRLGYFVGNESRAPYDLDELMAAVAPKPLLLVTPKLDRLAPLELITEAAECVRGVYELQNAAGNLTQAVTETYNHFDPINQKPVIEWMDKL